MQSVTTSAVLASIDAIDRLLPQTQCQRCGFADCRDYATALHEARAEVNRCPPGGDATRIALSELLRRDIGALPALADDVDAYAAEHVAFIDETTCIGCAKCLPACPTDAIVGASKRLHTVIAEDCTGCELCIIACPVDCITLEPERTLANESHATLNERATQSERLRTTYVAHKARFAERAEEGLAAMIESAPVAPDAAINKKALLGDILAKAKARASIGNAK